MPCASLALACAIADHESSVQSFSTASTFLSYFLAYPRATFLVRRSTGVTDLHTELPERAMLDNRLAMTIQAVSELMELRVGYRVELAALAPIDRAGCINLCAYWRPRLLWNRNTP